MRQHARQYILPVLLVLGAFTVLLLSPTPASAAWSEPTASPPGGNVAAPLNTSAVSQSKAGGLTINGLLVGNASIQASQAPGLTYGVQGTASNPNANQTTAGIWGVSGNATAVNSRTAGVYGIATGATGSSIGLLGVAGVDSTVTFGVYGWDQGNTNAYAGYFVGKVDVVGNLSATSYCLNGVCINNWSEVGGGNGTAWTEDPTNNTYLSNTNSNLALGGTTSANAKFFFNVGTGTETASNYYASNAVTIGAPTNYFVGDGICSVGEGCGGMDCANQPDGCPANKVCDPNGAAVCVDSVPPDITAPSKPTVSVNGTPTSDLVKTQWTVSTDTGGSGLAGYKIYRCTGSSCTPAFYASVGISTNYSDTVVAPLTTYNYDVTALDVAGNESGHSNRLQVTTPDVPPAPDTQAPTVPSNFRIDGTAGSTSIPLAWNASTDAGGSGLQGYKLYRCAGTVCTPTFYVDLGLALTYADTSVVNGSTTYQYQVTAYDGAANESAHSGTISVVAADTQAPTIPQNLGSSGVGYYVFQLRWQASTDAGGSNLGGYHIYRCTGTGCTPAPTSMTASAAATSYNDTTVSPGTTYNYEITAFDNAGNESGRSNRFQRTTPSTPTSPPTPCRGDGCPPPLLIKGGESSAKSFAAVDQPLLGGVRPLARLLAPQVASASTDLFSIPSAEAASPFGGTTPVRLTINNGVAQIYDAAGALMEIGNAGTDIASTGDLVLRPASVTQANGVTLSATAGKANLASPGKVEATQFCITGATPSCVTSWWNAPGPTPYILDKAADINTPQAAAISVTGDIYGSKLGIGATGNITAAGTYLNLWVEQGSTGKVGIGTKTPQGKLSVLGGVSIGTYASTNAPPINGLLVSGDVGIGTTTVAPYKVNVNGDLNATRLCIAGTCQNTWPAGGGIGGSGTVNYIPRFGIGGTTITNSHIYDNGNQIIINGTTAAGGALAVNGIGSGDGVYINNVSQTEWIRMYQGGVFYGSIGQGQSADSSSVYFGNFINSDIKFQYNQAQPTQFRFRRSGDLLVGGTNLDNPNTSQPSANANPEICLNDSCIDNWSALVLNSAAGPSPALPFPQTASFNISGSGTIGTSLQVDNGPIKLPTSNRTTLANEIQKDAGTLQGYNIAAKFIFGGNNTTPAYGLGFFEDDAQTSPILVIDENREVHLGYAAAPTKLCLYGSGGKECFNKLADISGDYIQNMHLDLTGYQDSARIAINGAIFGTELGIGAAGDPATANAYQIFYVDDVLPGNVGIRTKSPAAALDINGNLRVATSVQFSQLTNCDTIDTNASGVLQCGVDTGGSAGDFIQNMQSNLTGYQDSARIAINGAIFGTELGIGAAGDPATANAYNILYVDDTLPGNVGIRTKRPTSALSVADGVAIGRYADTAQALAATAPTNGLIVDGNVGIGTGVPAQKLEVRGSTILSDDDQSITAFATAYPLSIQDRNGNAYIEILNANGAGRGAFFGLTNTGNPNVGSQFQIWNYDKGAINFWTGLNPMEGSERLRISKAGNIGIAGNAAIPTGAELPALLTLYGGKIKSQGVSHATSAFYLEPETNTSGNFDFAVWDSAAGWGSGTARLNIDANTIGLQSRSSGNIVLGGNVAIRRSTPLATLDVMGTIWSIPTAYSAGTYTTYLAGIQNDFDYSTRSNRELRIATANNNAAFNQYILFNGRPPVAGLPGGQDSLNTAIQGVWGKFSAFEFTSGGDIRVLVNPGLGGDGVNEATITPTKALTILSNGNIGVGQAAPAAKFVINRDGVNNAGSADAGLSIYASNAGNALYVSQINAGYAAYFNGKVRIANNLSVTMDLSVTGNATVNRLREATLTHKTADYVDAVPPSNDSFNWVNVVHDYFVGATGDSSHWGQVALDPNRAVLGVQIYGSTDDSGICAAFIPGYFAGSAGFDCYLQELDTDSYMEDTNWNMCYANGANIMGLKTWIFSDIESGRRNMNITFCTDLGQACGNIKPYLKAAGVSYVPPGQSMWYYQRHRNNTGAYKNDCYIDVLYADASL